MTTYIAILRGINVGGHRKIKMDDLRNLLGNIDYQNIKTYIQSGNMIFQSKETEIKSMEQDIQGSIQAQFGFEVSVLVFKLSEFKQIAEQNPFIGDKTTDTAHLYITFLSEIPSIESINKINDLSFQPDEFQLINKAVYLYCPKGYGNTKLTNHFFENKLKVTATTRNWKTINELIKMIE